MDIKKATDLYLEIFTKCSLKKSKDVSEYIVPSSSTPNDKAEGTQLRFSLSIIDESSRKCIESIVKERKLKMINSEGYLVIYTPRKT